MYFHGHVHVVFGKQKNLVFLVNFTTSSSVVVFIGLQLQRQNKNSIKIQVFDVKLQHEAEEVEIPSLITFLHILL